MKENWNTKISQDYTKQRAILERLSFTIRWIALSSFRTTGNRGPCDLFYLSLHFPSDSIPPYHDQTLNQNILSVSIHKCLNQMCS